MKTSMLTLLGGVIAALMLHGAVAAESSPAKPAAKRPHAAKLSLAEKGSFHRVHERKAKTDCEDCHSDTPFADNVLLVSRNRPLEKGNPGPVDPKDCFECHRLKSNPPPLYVPHQ